MAENGAMFPGKSDIDTLIDRLKEVFDKKSSDKSTDDKDQQRQSIPTKPKYADLNSMVGNLGIAVPTGFWLIHNDLEDISKQLKGSGEGSAPSNLSWEDVADNLVSKLPALAGIIAGAAVANTLIKNTSMDDIISLMEAIPRVAGSLITEVGESLIGIVRTGGLAVMDIVDYFKDENLKAERQRLALMYMSLSYAGLFEGFGYTADIDDTTGEITGITKKSTAEGLESLFDSEHIGDTLNKGIGMVDNMFFGGKTVQGKAEKASMWIDVISDAIQENARGLAATVMDVKDIIADETVDTMRKKYLGLYLQAYYANLIRDMGFGVDFENDRLADLSTGERTLSVGKDLLTEGVTAFQTGGATLVAQGVADALAGVATTLAATFKSVVGLIEGNETVDKMSSKYAGLYMQAYWSGMIKNLGFTVDFENERLSGTAISIASLINDGVSVLSGLFTGLAQAGIGVVAKSVAKDSLLTSDEVSDASEKYAALYIQAYWLSIIDSLGYEINEDGAVVDLTGGREQRKGFFTNLKEGLFGDAATNLSNSIATSLQNNMGTVVSRMVTAGNFSLSASSYNDFLVSYFNMLRNHVLEKPTDWRWSPAGSISTFNHAMAAKLPEMELTQDVRTTIINEGRDYTNTLSSIKVSMDTMKNSIANIMTYINTNIVPDVKTIATNSERPSIAYEGEANTDWVSSEEPKQETN